VGATCVNWRKVAVVLALLPERTTVHVDEPEQAPLPPLQAEKMVPLEAVAVSVMATPLLKVFVQVPPEAVQKLIPAGLDDTEPLPLTETVTVLVAVAKVAVVAALEPESVMTQDEVPVQAPLQPEKVLALLVLAVSVTGTPSLKVPVQPAPPVEVQPVIPPELELTEPLPTTVTVMVC